MSGGLENIREQMVDYLKERGVQAFAAWPAGERPVQEGALVVVSLRGCQAGPAGFQHYLGERYDERTGLWQELYGRKAALTFGLDLYAPRGQGDVGIQTAFDQVVQAFGRSPGAGRSGGGLRRDSLRRPGQADEAARPGGMPGLSLRRGPARRALYRL